MLLKYEFSAQDCDVKKYEERQSGGSVVVIKFTSAFCANGDIAWA